MLVVSSVWLSSVALAWPAPPTLGLDELTAAADAVCVSTITSIAPSPSSPDGPGPWAVAQLEPVRSLKGDCEAHATFRYRTPDWLRNPFGSKVTEFQPEVGGTWLLFVVAGASGAWEPSAAQLEPIDEVGLLRLNPKKARGRSVREAVWRSLTSDLGSSDPETARRSIAWLDRLSSPLGPSPDFDRRETTRLVVAQLRFEDPGVADAALAFLETTSPLAHDHLLVHRLEALRPGSFPGIGKLEPGGPNWGALDHFDSLVSFANRAPPELRARAIRTLSGHGRSEVPPAIRAALADPVPAVRAAATVLLGELPAAERSSGLAAAAVDPEPVVRAAAARALALAQDPDGLPLLEGLLGDPEPAVRRDAALGLLALGDDAALARHVDAPIWGGLFVNAVATADPGPWIERLTALVRDQYRLAPPTRWWGGTIPYGRSWDLLFAWVSALEPSVFGSDATAPALEALERSTFHDSTDPTALYRLYRDRGLDDRADAFRAHCASTAFADLSLYFDRVDAAR